MAVEMEEPPQRLVEMEDAAEVAAAFLVRLVGQDHRGLEEVRAMLRMLVEAVVAEWGLGAQQVVHSLAQEQTDSKAETACKSRLQEQQPIMLEVGAAAAVMEYQVAPWAVKEEAAQVEARLQQRLAHLASEVVAAQALQVALELSLWPICYLGKLIRSPHPQSRPVLFSGWTVRIQLAQVFSLQTARPSQRGLIRVEMVKMPRPRQRPPIPSPPSLSFLQEHSIIQHLSRQCQQQSAFSW
jgi:hypothetical protein